MAAFRTFLCAVATVLVVVATTEAANLRGSVANQNCGAPPSVYQGTVKFSSTTYPATATYKCMKGTSLKGSSSLSCTKTGLWSGTPPECRVTYLASKDGTYKNGDKGYQLYSG